MKEEKKNLEVTDLDVSFSFDNLDILGVHQDEEFTFVSLRGEMWSEEKDDFEPVVIEMVQETFQNALSLWLKEKQHFCEAYGEFCGKMGSIRALSCDVMDYKCSLLTGFDETKGEEGEPIYTEVPVVVMYEFSDCVDMEHG